MTEDISQEPVQRIVMVTGANRGIGAACAKWFVQNGDLVLATYRTKTADLEELAKSISGPGKLVPVQLDVSKADSVNSAFDSLEAEYGSLDVLVSNAGITKDTLALRMDEETFQEVINTNLTGSFRVAKRALAKMLRKHQGRIIFVSSIGAFVGLPGQANYAASKAGLVGMARSLAREVASRSITVNVVAPGMVATGMIAALGEAREREITASVPLGRAAEPSEVASAVGFIASKEAGYITGAVLPVDGGLGMGW